MINYNKGIIDTRALSFMQEYAQEHLEDTDPKIHEAVSAILTIQDVLAYEVLPQIHTDDNDNELFPIDCLNIVQKKVAEYILKNNIGGKDWDSVENISYHLNMWQLNKIFVNSCEGIDITPNGSIIPGYDMLVRSIVTCANIADTGICFVAFGAKLGYVIYGADKELLDELRMIVYSRSEARAQLAGTKGVTIELADFE